MVVFRHLCFDMGQRVNNTYFCVRLGRGGSMHETCVTSFIIVPQFSNFQKSVSYRFWYPRLLKHKLCDVIYECSLTQIQIVGSALHQDLCLLCWHFKECNICTSTQYQNISFITDKNLINNVSNLRCLINGDYWYTLVDADFVVFTLLFVKNNLVNKIFLHIL